jgi:peptide/nickel transport system permease protein
LKAVLARWFDSDVGHSFRTSPVAMVAAASRSCACSARPSRLGGAAQPVRPHHAGAGRRPAAAGLGGGGSRKYLLGTDDQGRDILSVLMYGARISLVVGIVSVLLSMVIGVALGLLAGFLGGWVDTFLMRLCDVMLSFPAILVALLIAGVGRALFPNAPTRSPSAC